MSLGFLVLGLLPILAIIGVAVAALTAGVDELARRLEIAWWARTERFPQIVRRGYRTLAACEFDRLRMEQAGYRVVDRVESEPPRLDPLLPSRYSRYQQQVPLVLVVYSRATAG